MPPALTQKENTHLKLHKEVLLQYLENPEKATRLALSNLKKWKSQGVHSPSYHQWEEILKNPTKVPEVLSSQTPEAIELRKSSPFAGLLPEKVRQAIIRQVP